MKKGERLVVRCRVAQASEAGAAAILRLMSRPTEAGSGGPFVRDGQAERRGLVRAGFVASAVALETALRLGALRRWEAQLCE